MQEKSLKKLLNIVTVIMLVLTISMPALAFAAETKYNAENVSYTGTVLRGGSLKISGNISCSRDIKYVRLSVTDHNGDIELQKTARSTGRNYDLSKFNSKIDTSALTQGNKMLTIFCYTDAAEKCVYTGGFTAINETAGHVSFSLDPGRQIYNSTLSLSTDTEGAKIFYTTDGSHPTTGSKLYTGELTLKKDTFLTAVAYKNGMSYSGITSAYFDVLKLNPEYIILDQHHLTMSKDSTYALSATILPKGAEHAGITFSSSNENVATVDEKGTIATVGSGSARIIASTENDISSTCVVSCDITHTHYHQGDEKWDIPYEEKKTLCLTTSYAMVLKNLGFNTDPNKLYHALGGAGASQPGIENVHNVIHVPAVSQNSSYYSNYYYGRTYISNPEKNAEKAAVEALASHPEGVIMYFKNGENMHAVVAVGVNANGDILYDDPGRKINLGHNVTFENSWLGVEGYDYSHLDCIIALD